MMHQSSISRGMWPARKNEDTCGDQSTCSKSENSRLPRPSHEGSACCARQYRIETRLLCGEPSGNLLCNKVEACPKGVFLLTQFRCKMLPQSRRTLVKSTNLGAMRHA